MFGNRWFYPKLLLAFGLFFGSCAVADHFGKWINPSPIRAALLAPRYEGETLWIPGATVDRVTDDGFVIRLRNRDVVVHGRSDVREGDTVEILARFRSPDRLELVEVRPHRVPGWRLLGNAVSIAVVLAVLWIFWKRFRVRRGAWEVKWPTS